MTDTDYGMRTKRLINQAMENLELKVELTGVFLSEDEEDVTLSFGVSGTKYRFKTWVEKAELDEALDKAEIDWEHPFFSEMELEKEIKKRLWGPDGLLLFDVQSSKAAKNVYRAIKGGQTRIGINYKMFEADENTTLRDVKRWAGLKEK